MGFVVKKAGGLQELMFRRVNCHSTNVPCSPSSRADIIDTCWALSPSVLAAQLKQEDGLGQSLQITVTLNLKKKNVKYLLHTSILRLVLL